MSTSLLYHGFGMVGYTYIHTIYTEGSLVFSARTKRNKLRCPQCHSKRVIRRGTVERYFRTLPIGKKTVWVKVPVPRVECSKCQALRRTTLGLADPGKRYTKAFERYVLDLSSYMTIQDVANHLGISWDTVKDIQKRELLKRYTKPRLKDLEYIAIDEITIGQGHKYLTVVLDLQTGRVVFVGEGKGAEALEPFWKRLKPSGARIKAVAIDMSPAYIQAIASHLPDADIVFDRFYVTKLFNDRLSDFRRKLFHQLSDPLQQEMIKGTRWLLLKNPENLDADKDEHERLQKALEINQPLATAYYMKEDLRQIWMQQDKASAERVLEDWAARAKASKISMLKKFADTLVAHKSGILAYYDHRISTAPLEGTNNKIKTMKRQAYGFRDKKFFHLKIMAIHRTKYCLTG